MKFNFHPHVNLNHKIDIIIVAFTLVLLAAVGLLIFLKRPHKLKTNYFIIKWQELQKLCVDKSTWALAIINADKLLEEALKKAHFKGKTMGERLVAAQHSLTDNDSVWYGHKLRNRLVHEESVKLRKSHVQDALMGFRQALRDLGAMK